MNMSYFNTTTPLIIMKLFLTAKCSTANGHTRGKYLQLKCPKATQGTVDWQRVVKRVTELSKPNTQRVFLTSNHHHSTT